MTSKQFLGKILIVALALSLTDRGAGWLLAHFYHRIHHGEQGRMNWAIDSCVAKTIVLGSSRASHHYVADIIGSELSTTCYNAGRDKQRLPYCLAMLKMLYKRYSPEMVILDLNPTAFNADENGLSELGALLPYYGGHPEIRPVVDKRTRFERVKAQSMLYCYNSLPLKILFNSLSGAGDAGESNGYVPLTAHKEPIPPVQPSLPELYPVDPALVSCFREIVALTAKQHTRLIVVVSPLYYLLPENLPTISLATEIAGQNKVLFFDYSRSENYVRNGPDHFLDLSHLNDAAARSFSRSLADSLLKTVRGSKQ